MRRYLFSASSALRVENCPVSTVLPSLKESSDASEKGNDNHAKQQTCLVHRQATGKWPENTPPELMALVPDDATILGIELALAWDTATSKARNIGENISRNYGELVPTEIPGTVDLVFAHGGKLYVVDWKSRTRVTSARRNRQIHIQAIACADLFGASEVIAGLVYLDNWESDLATFDGFQLDDLAVEVAAIMTAAADAEPTQQPHLGPWCEYCPAQIECPSKSRQLVSVVKLLRSDDAEAIGAMPDEKVGDLYAQLATFEDRVKSVMKIIRDRARRYPIPVGEGKELRAIECESQKVDMGKCESLLKQNGIPVPVYTSTYVQVRIVNERKDKELRERNV